MSAVAVTIFLHYNKINKYLLSKVYVKEMEVNDESRQIWETGTYF